MLSNAWVILKNKIYLPRKILFFGIIAANKKMKGIVGAFLPRKMFSVIYGMIDAI